MRDKEIDGVFSETIPAGYFAKLALRRIQSLDADKASAWAEAVREEVTNSNGGQPQ